MQQRAGRNMRRHVLRAIRRFAVLAIADLASYAVMRELLRAVRDQQVLGSWLAGQVYSVLPPAILNGWQFAAALFVGLFVTGNYGYADQRRSPHRLFLGCALATALPFWMTIWTNGLELVVLQYTLVTGLVWMGLVAERLIIDRLVTRILRPDRSAAPALFVGPAEQCGAAMTSAAFAPGGEYRPVGFVDVHIPPAPSALGHIVDFPRLLHDSRAETVVVCGYLTDARFHEVVDAALAAGCGVFSVPRAIEIAAVQPTLVWRRGAPLIELSRPTLRGRQLFLKRMLDLGGSGLGLLIVAPLMLAIAAAVKLESKGPAVFWHRRLGKNGRVFSCYKFRSMRADAEERLRADPALYEAYVRNHYKLSEERDPRLTRIGRFLRRTSLDELPQLINVFKGEMSLVGPRPIVPEELGQYGQAAGVFLSLKPGMTGAWAVNGRSRVGYPSRADIELDYVRQWSLGRDLSILLRTFRTVLVGAGAE